jgi:hypothetical protein
MGWVTTGDAAGFLAEAGAFLRAERARNTVLLTVTETARADPSHFAPDEAGQDRRPLFGWWTAGDGTVGGRRSRAKSMRPRAPTTRPRCGRG